MGKVGGVQKKWMNKVEIVDESLDIGWQTEGKMRNFIGRQEKNYDTDEKGTRETDSCLLGFTTE